MQKTLHSKDYKKLTSWLKAQRASQGLTMRELAMKMGVTHSFIGKVEQGERRLDVIEYLSYCDVLGVSPSAGLRVVSKNIS